MEVIMLKDRLAAAEKEAALVPEMERLLEQFDDAISSIEREKAEVAMRNKEMEEKLYAADAETNELRERLQLIEENLQQHQRHISSKKEGDGRPPLWNREPVIVSPERRSQELHSIVRESPASARRSIEKAKIEMMVLLAEHKGKWAQARTVGLKKILESLLLCIQDREDVQVFSEGGINANDTDIWQQISNEVNVASDASLITSAIELNSNLTDEETKCIELFDKALGVVFDGAKHGAENRGYLKALEESATEIEQICTWSKKKIEALEQTIIALQNEAGASEA